MSQPCERWPECGQLPAHAAERHNDPRDAMYDGPGLTLQILPLAVRDSARKIVADAPGLTPEVIDLANHIQHLRNQVSRAVVDREHAVRQAGAVALDCDAHGKIIRDLEVQLHATDTSLGRTESARLALLGFLYEVDKVVKHSRADLTTTQLLAGLARMSRKVHAAHTRAWSTTP